MSEGFFDRWSRRKQEAREEAAPAPDLLPSLPGEGRGGGSTHTPPAEIASPHPDLPSEGEGEAAPALSLADTETLTIDSDFRPFVAKGVQPEVKNAAFRKLFADPHFNVMDGMDTYIDDYSVSTPIPDSVLRQMASAHFLKLFDEPPEEPAEEAADKPADAPMALEDPNAVNPATDLPEDVAQSDAPGNLPSPPAADAQPASHRHDDPNADLRLQPDDAARAEDARPRAV